jgi:hypothetical protein
MGLGIVVLKGNVSFPLWRHSCNSSLLLLQSLDMASRIGRVSTFQDIHKDNPSLVPKDGTHDFSSERLSSEFLVFRQIFV